MDFDFDGDCDGLGLGWIFPAIIVGKIIGEVFDRPRSPAQPQPQPAPQRDNPPARAASAEPKNVVPCPNCDHTFSADFKFCPQCGTRVAPRTCRYCNQPLDKQMTYCPHCGGPTKA